MIRDKLISDREEYIRARDTLENDYKYILKTELPPVYYIYQGIINYIDYLLEKIDEEDKDIPLIPDDELCIFKGLEKLKSTTNEMLNFNFKVLQEKINQVIEAINNES